MSADEFDPAWAHTCPACARIVKEQEAADGLRCSSCLESFDNKYPYRTQSDEDPELCRSCRIGAKTRVAAPGRGGMYGSAGPAHG